MSSPARHPRGGLRRAGARALALGIACATLPAAAAGTAAPPTFVESARQVLYGPETLLFHTESDGTQPLDLDGDGRDELLLFRQRLRPTTPPFQLPAVVLAFEGGQWVDRTTRYFPGGLPAIGFARTVLAADFSGDGRRDLVIIGTGPELGWPDDRNYPGQVVEYYTRNADATYTRRTGDWFPALVGFWHGGCERLNPATGARDIALVHLGRGDLGNPNYSPGLTRVSYFLNDGSGRFARRDDWLPSDAINIDLSPGNYFETDACAFADVDGDGYDDLFLTQAGPLPGAPLAASTSQRLYWGSASGRYSPLLKTLLPRPAYVPVPAGEPMSPGAPPVIADFTGDGLRDLALMFVGPLAPYPQFLRQVAPRQFVDDSEARFGVRQWTFSWFPGFEGFPPVSRFRRIDIGGSRGPGLLVVSAGGRRDRIHEMVLLNDGRGVFRRVAAGVFPDRIEGGQPLMVTTIPFVGRFDTDPRPDVGLLFEAFDDANGQVKLTAFSTLAEVDGDALFAADMEWWETL